MALLATGGSSVSNAFTHLGLHVAIKGGSEEKKRRGMGPRFQKNAHQKAKTVQDTRRNWGEWPPNITWKRGELTVSFSERTYGIERDESEKSVTQNSR